MQSRPNARLHLVKTSKSRFLPGHLYAISRGLLISIIDQKHSYLHPGSKMKKGTSNKGKCLMFSVIRKVSRSTIVTNVFIIFWPDSSVTGQHFGHLNNFSSHIYNIHSLLNENNLYVPPSYYI